MSRNDFDFDFSQESRAPRNPQNGQSRRPQGNGGAANKSGQFNDYSVYENGRLEDLDNELYGYEQDSYGSATSRTSGSRSSASRSSGSRPSGSRPSGSRPSGSRSSGSRSSASRPSNSRGNSSRNSSNRKPARNNSSRSSNGGNRGGRGGKKKSDGKKIVIIEIVVAILLIVGVAIYLTLGKMNWDNSISIDNLEVNNLDDATEEILDNYTTLAFFGVDNRSNGKYEGGNSDSMMVVSINKDTKEVNIVSVMRDTYLNVDDGDTYRKCNYAYNHGGPEQAINMLNRNFDLKVSGYVSVDFMALAKIVDDLGGLEVEITQAMVDATNPETGGPALAGYIAEVQTVIDGKYKESECFLQPGVQKLNGTQIVGYCRQRYCGGDDYGRTERQREVVSKIMNEAVNADVATRVKIAKDVFPYVSTSLELDDIVSMGKDAKDYKIASTSGFPFDLTTGTYGKKGSLVVPCTLSDNVTKLHGFLFSQDNYTPTETVTNISEKIQNDTGTSASSATVNQENDK